MIRLNRDTLYTSAIVDLDAGPVTITLPDAGKRFMSLMVVSEDQYTWTEYGAGRTHSTRTRSERATRSSASARSSTRRTRRTSPPYTSCRTRSSCRNLAGPAHSICPAYDTSSQKKVRDALIALAATMPSFDHAFGTRDQVDPVTHLIGSAAAWGGNPDKDAKYINVTPAKNDGKTVYTLVVRDVPVDAFWSVSVYNAKGYYEKNALDAYTVNNLTGKKGKDGAIKIQFGGCAGRIVNCIPITDGWNYTVRLYRPSRGNSRRLVEVSGAAAGELSHSIESRRTSRLSKL